MRRWIRNNYVDQSKPEIKKLVEIIKKEIPEKYQIILEPGRSIVGRSGILIAKVEYIKKGIKNFLVVDAAMNDLVRPSLYQAEHEVLPCNESLHNPETFDIVGPICETGDWLAKDKSFSVKRGDYIACWMSGLILFQCQATTTRVHVP